jgi:hypothetical protein
MDNKSEKAILRAKLEWYRLLSRQFPDGMTAKNIRLVSAEVELCANTVKMPIRDSLTRAQAGNTAIISL